MTLPDGAAWWFARVLAGMANGQEQPHGRVQIWGSTRTTLDLALKGYTVKLARRTACPGS